MAGRARGMAREIKVCKRLRADGWVAFTTKNDGCDHPDKKTSHGIVDVIAVQGTMVRLIQVKSTARPWERFGPAHRAELAAEAKLAGAIAELWWWPKGAREPKVYPEVLWPT